MSNLDQFAPVFERLLEAMVDDARAVNLDANVLPGRVNWSFRVDINDAGKIIGMGGCHIRALKLVTELAGRQENQQWVAAALDPTGVEREEKKVRVPAPAKHNPISDALLIGDVLDALGLSVEVTAEGNVPAGYSFVLRGKAHQDLDALLEMHPAIYGERQRQRDPLNLIGALGTIFRAIGLRQGVKYHLDAPTS